MKPSHHNISAALLWMIPMTIYCAALGWKFAFGMLGFVILSHVMRRLAAKIVGEPAKSEKK